MNSNIKNVLTVTVATFMLLVASTPSLLSAQIGGQQHHPVMPPSWPDKKDIYETLFGVDVNYPDDIDKMLLTTDLEITAEGSYSGTAQDGAFTTDVLNYTMIDVETVLPHLNPDQQNYVLEHNLTGGLVRGDFTSNLATVSSVVCLAFSQDINSTREHRLWVIGYAPAPTEIPPDFWDQYFFDLMRGDGGDRGDKPPLFTCPPGYKLKSAQCYNDVVQECNDWIASEVNWANAQIDLAGQALEDDLHDIGESELTCNMWISLAMGPYGLILDGATLIAIAGAFANYNSTVDDIIAEMEANIAAINELFAAEGIEKCCIKAPPLPGIGADGSVTLIFKIKRSGGGNNGGDGTILRALLSVMDQTEFNSWAGDVDQGLGFVDEDGVLFSLYNSRQLLIKENSVNSIDIGQSIDESFTVNSPNPIRVSVAWTDKEAGCCSRLKNDLDVILKAPNGIDYHGNVFSEGQSVPNPITWDTRNTDENFVIDNPIPGEWQLTVVAQELPHGPQSYVYAITGDISKTQNGEENLITPSETKTIVSFNSITKGNINLSIILSVPTHVDAQVFDPTGRLVATILDSDIPAGENVFQYKSNLPNGVYFVKVTAGKTTMTGKVMIVR
ncbi:hypothetical protein AMJ52_01465 [candidate division TA06 bacterium DG_78]|uniref:Secretion system C-terminal sorting domain-containing protein n=1 Tax=candidate division TA06 bacterium DG_78 TaxID=1703772 RepID=A0A0S7YHT1_UNCT6|nr:MAG: hypothetical protein AMJ52_01465 [candidate division TA06 bacterium DG_78]